MMVYRDLFEVRFMLRLCCKEIAWLTVIAAAVANTAEAVNEKQEVIERAKATIMQGILFVVIPLLLAILIIFAPGIFHYVHQWFSRFMIVLKGGLSVIEVHKGTDFSSVNESLDVIGYAYDPNQDIFYSTLNPWQKDFGYCRLYDEAAAPLGMIIDCEPIYFDYGGKRWMIEFWKGQYDLTTGCEIGVYTTERPELNIPGVFNGTFYNFPGSGDFLNMSYSLLKKGKPLFIRKGMHWWLTGFKLGVFSEPSELSMYIIITLKDRIMRNAFVQGLKNAGYSDNEIAVYRNTVYLIFGKPHTSQPLSRTKATDTIIQKKNKLLCAEYQEITRGCITLQDKIEAVQEKAPEMYGHIIGLGRPKELFSRYEVIKKYLS